MMKVHFRWWLWSLTAAVAAVVVACSPAAPPTPTPVPLPDPQMLIDGAVQQMAAEKYISFVFDHPVGNTPLAPGAAITRAEGVAILPDQFNVGLDMESAGTALHLGLISTGDTAYMTNPLSGEWTQATPAQIPFKFEYISGLVGAMLGEVSDLETVGETDLEGTPAWLIKGLTSTAALGQVIPGAQTDAQLNVEVWVDQASGKLLRAQMLGALVPDEDPETVRALTLESLAEPPDISPP